MGVFFPFTLTLVLSTQKACENEDKTHHQIDTTILLVTNEHFDWTKWKRGQDTKIYLKDCNN